MHTGLTPPGNTPYENGGFISVAPAPLDPTMPTVDGYRAVLVVLAKTMRANWQGTIDQSDTEYLHDLRIAVRCTRTVLDEAKGVFPAEVRDPARKGFAKMSDLTGPARDLDVYLLGWNRYTGPLGAETAPALAPVRALLERRCADAHSALDHALSSEWAGDLTGRWETWLDEPLCDEHRGKRANWPLGRRIAKRVNRAHAVVLERGRRIGPDAPADQVHDLRKDAKKLRYLLECFGSLTPDNRRKRFVGRLKNLQDNLGEHQDAVVHLSMLRGIARELHRAGASTDTMLAIGRLTERLDWGRTAARAEFAERFARYDTPATHHDLDAMLHGLT